MTSTCRRRRAQRLAVVLLVASTLTAVAFAASGAAATGSLGLARPSAIVAAGGHVDCGTAGRHPDRADHNRPSGADDQGQAPGACERRSRSRLRAGGCWLSTRPVR